MARELHQAGRCIVKDGRTYFTNEYLSIDGLGYGYVYKNERAFMEQPDEVCYIPEHAFDDVQPVRVDSKDYYPADEVGGYTRHDLEELVNGETDEDGDAITVEDFFRSLFWCYPETRLNELTC